MTNTIILMLMMGTLTVLWFIICREDHCVKRNVLRFSNWLGSFFRIGARL